MRVVVDGWIYGASSEGGGGISRYWTEVIRTLVRMDVPIRLDVVVSREAYHPAGVPCRDSRSLMARLAAWRSDIFHTSYYTHWPRMKQPSVVTAYDFIDASFPLLQTNERGFVARQLESIGRASAVITISQASRELTLELAGVDPARVFVAYPAVGAPFSLPPPGATELRDFRRKYTKGAPYLLHVGQRRSYKNFQTILRAFCLAASSTERHLLIVGGKFPFADYELGWLFDAGLLDRIHYYPWVDDATLRLAYAGADAMVHASLMEGFGIPVIEALACGTGLILSDIPVYREIAERRAIFVAATDVEAWAHAMQGDVPVQPEWREEVLSQYTWEAAARVHMSAYESVQK